MPGGNGTVPKVNIIPEEQPPLIEEPPIAGPPWFQDVNPADWFYNSVRYVFENGLMNGTSESPMLFSPNALLTRAMIVTILYRQAGSPSVAGLTNPFSDVPDGQWFTNAVIWAAENGIVQGIGGGLYDPNTNITREQLATILYRYAQFLDKTPDGSLVGTLSFADANLISDYAKDAALFCVNNGIITGKPGDLFDPKGQATRAEAATMLNRFIETLLTSASVAESGSVIDDITEADGDEGSDEGEATEPVKE